MFHPGEIIRELWLEGTPTHLAADRIGVSLDVFEGLLRGRSDITPELARKLAAAARSQAGFWLRLQARYDRSRKGGVPGTLASVSSADGTERPESRT